MIRILLSIILVSLSLFIVFSYALPEYRATQVHKATLTTLGDVLQKTKDATELMAGLASSLASITLADTEKMKVILPADMDEIRFVHMLSRIITGGTVTLKGVTIAETGRDLETATSPVAVALKKDAVRKLVVNVSFTASYSDFVRILADIEKSVALMDITNLSLSGDGKGGLYDYTMTIQSYWSQDKK